MHNINLNGEKMYAMVDELFPICRSITGNGFRESLGIIRKYLPEMKTFEIPTGTEVFDWKVPREWNIRDAWIATPEGRKICRFNDCNLHVVGYSTPISAKMSLAELQQHLYSLPDQPDVVPYITSYYAERWGFCISHAERAKLKDGEYEIFIDSELKDGSLTYGELILPGREKKEVFLSTYLCHPSMANNELSGPVVATFIALWLKRQGNIKYTYRLIFIPETIGSITYLSKNLAELKRKMTAGFNLTCIGDNRTYSYLPSRQGDTLADKTAMHVLKHHFPEYVSYSFLDRGSDERQYCSPGVDLPVCSIMRSKYACYPEYHTSADNLSVVSPAGLYGGFEVIRKCIQCLELDEVLVTKMCCEPQLGKRGLYPTLSTKNLAEDIRRIRDFIAYCDGKKSALEIAEIIGCPLWELAETIDRLKEENLIEKVRSRAPQKR